jgi:hypothetical protein
VVPPQEGLGADDPSIAGADERLVVDSELTARHRPPYVALLTLKLPAHSR